MPEPSPWPLVLPQEPYTAAQYECYLNAAEKFLQGWAACLAAGGPVSVVEACIQAKYDIYLANLPICDTL